MSYVIHKTMHLTVYTSQVIQTTHLRNSSVGKKEKKGEKNTQKTKIACTGSGW